MRRMPSLAAASKRVDKSRLEFGKAVGEPKAIVSLHTFNPYAATSEP